MSEFVQDSHFMFSCTFFPSTIDVFEHTHYSQEYGALIPPFSNIIFGS